MAAVRHPCVGDLTYGADPTLAARLGLDRQWLHASALGFAHPADGREMRLHQPARRRTCSAPLTCWPRRSRAAFGGSGDAPGRHADTCRWAVLERRGTSAAFPARPFVAHH